MTRAIAVIDTNVIVAGLLTSDPGAPTARIVDGMRSGTFSFLLSTTLLAEYRTVLLRPKIRLLHKLQERDVDALLTVIVANGIVREPEPAAGSPDPEDSHVWSLLHSERGCVLVTGDHALIEAPLEAASVMTPRQFVDSLLT